MESTSTSTLAATPLHVRDVVRIPSGSEAVVESIDLESSTAVCAWNGTRSTFALVDLVWLQHGAPSAATSDAIGPEATGGPAAGEESASAGPTLEDFADNLSVVQRVKEFFQHAEEDVKEAFHGEVLGKIDALGPGASVIRDETTTTVTAWRNGARIHGHGTTAAAALADFHKNAGPA